MEYRFVDYQQAKEKVLETLQQACNFFRKCAPYLNAASQRCEVLAESIQRLRKDVFNLVVAGEFSSGKSFLINVLIDAYHVDADKGKVRGLLPDRVSPTTSAITLIQHGEEPKVTAFFSDGSQQEVDIDHLSEFVADPSFKNRYLTAQTEEGFHGQAADVLSKGVSWTTAPFSSWHEKSTLRRVVIDYNSRLLEQGVCVVDTPGTGSAIREHAEVTREFIPQADAIIFLFPAQPPINKPTQLFLSQCAMHVDRMFFVQTMKDREYELSRDGEWKPRMEGDIPVVEVALQENLRIIREVVPKVSRVYTVSAKWYALSCRGFHAPDPEESGIPQLLQDLETFLVRERGYAALRTQLRRAHAYLQEADEQLKTSIEAKQRSIAELKVQLQSLRQLTQCVQNWIERAQEEIHSAFLSVRRRVEDDYPSAVEELAGKLCSRIRECGNVSQLRALDVSLSLVASSYANTVLSRWTHDHLRRALDDLYKNLRSGSLSSVDLSEGALKQLPQHTRYALSRLIGKMMLPIAMEFNDVALHVRSTIDANFEWWQWLLSRIPIIGDLLSLGKVHEVKQQLLRDAKDLSIEVLSKTKKSFLETLAEREEEMASGMRQELQSFLSTHLAPIEQELSKEENERQKEAQQIEEYRCCQQECVQMLTLVESLYEQIGAADVQGANTPPATDVPNPAARMQ